MTNGRLLWVDDEIDLLKPYMIFLRGKGYDVSTASNGTDAIDLCRESDFDLILLDENMPGLSGLETLAGIKEIRPAVPVVMVTKNEAEDLMNQAIGAKIADYLIKPVHPNQILLALKKNIHRREIVSEVAESAYRREFAQIGMQISDSLTPEEWIELYKKLVHWELELAETGGPMADMLRMQKEEANQNFAKYIRNHYEEWFTPDAERPLISPDVMKRVVFPRLNAGKRVRLFVLDNFRFDQWRVLAEELKNDFDIDEDLYFSILPTATQYARNALFAGMMPADIRKNLPSLWVEEEDEEGKNLFEEEMVRQLLQRYRRKETFTYHKINGAADADRLLSAQSQLAAARLNIIVVNFIDILSHARTESRMVRELAGNEAAFRGVTRSWFLHSAISDIFRMSTPPDTETIVTTDHGSIRTTTPCKVVGDRNVNTNLRYKLGKNLGYNRREVYEVKQPARIGLPAPNLSTTYIFATGDRFFAYPNNYNHYVQYYKDTFQHGGISMEEMIIPLVTLRPKGDRN